MKHFFSMMAFVMLTAGQSWASGCGGGYWRVVADNELPAIEILFRRYGEPKFEVQVVGDLANVTLTNVGTEGKKMRFVSGYFSHKNERLTELLKALYDSKPLLATVHQTISTNLYYDDCQDIPEGSEQIATRVEFVVNFLNGQTQKFSSYEIETNRSDVQP